MKIKKLLFTSVVLAFVFLLGACQPVHVHTYSDEYTYNETQHWFAATCEHNEEKNEVENHNFSSWTTKTSKTCTTDEILSRSCLTCFYEETKVGEKAGHTLQDVKGIAATCETDGVKAHKHCTVCNKNFDNEGKELSSVTISKLGHSKLDEWQHDENNHYKVCTNNGCVLTFDVSEHTYGEWETKTPATCSAKEVQQRTCSVCSYVETKEVGDYANHTLTDVAETPKTCTTDGIKAHKHCSVCEKDFDAEGNVLSAADLVIEASHNLDDEYVVNETTHKVDCLDCDYFVEEEHEHDENTGLCVCGKDLTITPIATHTGVELWDITNNDEKVSSNGVFVHNVSNVPMNGDKLANFSLEIQHKGWENNGERTYFYTIKSVDGVLTLDNQLGKEPWTFTTFTLTDEHKARLASSEGLDFVVRFDKVNQKMELYIYTEHELELLHTLDTYYGSMDNFYKVKYVLTGEATVKTNTYKVYDTPILDVFELLNIDLTEHNLQDVVAVAPTCEEDGIVAHKHCTICLKNYDLEGNLLSTVVDPATDHNYSTEWTKGETTHYHACLNSNCDSKSDEEPHNMVFTETKVPPTEEVEGIEIWTCSVCGKQEERNIGKADHVHTFDESVWVTDGNKHWHPSTCGHDVYGSAEEHQLEAIEQTDADCVNKGTIAHNHCTVCGRNYDDNKNELSDSDLEIPLTDHTYSEEWTKDETYHWHVATCEHTTEISGKENHSYDSTGTCVCGKEVVLTLLGTHTGTDLWEITNNSEKLSSNGVFVHNVSNVPMDGDQLSDFSLQIQYRGWENNGERTYFYTIKSVDGVLTLDNQLGIDPWTFTTFTLSDEHKARLASAEGLDFVVYFDSVNQKMELYIYTSHELKQLHSLKTYYGSMSNFYKFKYVLTEEATVSTKIYKTYDSTVEDVYEELGLVLSDHVLVLVDAVAPTCEEDGIVAHKVCIMCGATFDLENKALDSIVDPKTGHNYSTELTKGETTHYYACLNANCDSKSDEEPHNMVFTETKVAATEEVDGIEIWTCSVCGKQEERNIGKLAHTHTYKDSYSYDGTSHWYDATCGHDVKGGLEDHTFIEYEEVPPTCNETGTIAYKECSVCHAKYDLEGNEVDDLTINATGHTYSEEWTKDETYHWHVATCEHTTEISGKENHSYDSTGTCVCGKEVVLTLLGTHTGTDLWEITNNSEKLSSNGVFVHNVSNVPMDGDQLSDFSLQIQYRGWENNGERTYFYTIKSVDGVLTLDNQLGIDPWTFTTFTLSDEHKARLASAEGLDFVVYFDSVNQKMELYIYTSHELKQLHSLKTYYGSMSNFYKFKYVLTEEATVSTKIYKTYDSTVEDVYEELGLVLSDHVLVLVDAVAPTCEEDGIVAHKVCIMCGATFDLENKALDSIVDPKTGHNYSTELTKGETTHYYACLNANCDSKSDEEPHNMVFTETKVAATEEVDGIEIWTCSVCGKQEERNIGKLAHTHTYKDSYSYDGTSHWYDATCGHDVKGGLEDHTFIEYEEVPPTCNETGTIAYKECSVCHAKYDLEGNEVDDLTINATGHTYSEEWTKDETYHWHEATCEHSTLTTEKVEHEYSDLTGLCECGKKLQLTLLASHSGNNTWSLTDDEKITTSAIIHENISNAVVSEGKLVDFEHYIVYKGWGSAYEPYYLYINSSNDVLTLKLKLGREPWTEYGTYTLADEHKDRIASESGLDFVLHFNKETNKLSGYVYTNHQLDKLFEITCYSTISNFYEVGYKTNSGTFGTLTTSIYKSYDTSVNEIFNTLNIALTEHSYRNVNETSASCNTDGIAEHKECIICGHKVGMDGNEVDVIPMTGHTYVEGTCSVCSKTNPLTFHASQTWTGQSTWDYSDAYFSFAFHENFKYVSSELGDFTETIKYDGWGAAGLAYSLVLSSSSDALSVTIAGETVQLGSEYIDSLLSEEGLDIFVTFDNTTKEFCIYAIADNKVNLLIDFVCWDTKVAGFYKSTISSHDSNVIVNSVIYKITDEFDAESDLKNL